MALTTRQLAEAIYTINRHAKTAPEPKQLYTLKKEALNKLIRENRAVKKGLHFSDHPKYSNQHSTLLIQIDEFYFHIPPTKKDFKNLKHLGTLDHSYRNPQIKMPLSKAKNMIYSYLGWRKKTHTKKRHHSYNYYTPAVLGKFSWKPENPNSPTAHLRRK